MRQALRGVLEIFQLFAFPKYILNPLKDENLQKIPIWKKKIIGMYVHFQVHVNAI